MLRGAMHLDYRRVQRDGDFRAAFWVEGMPALLACAVIPPLAPLGHAAFAWALLAQTVLAAGGIARRRRARLPPRLRCRVLREALAFGVPVALNGMVMFAVLQGDRVLVAGFLTAEALGRFVIVGQCALLPALALTRVLLAVRLPALAREQASPDALRSALLAQGRRLLPVAAVAAAAFALLAPMIVSLLFGAAFAPSSALAAAFAALAALRLLRAVPSLGFLAIGRTRALLLSSLPRLAALGAAAWLLLAGDASLATVVAVGAVGEALALFTGVALLARATRSPRGAAVDPVTQTVERHLCMGCGGCAAAFPGRVTMVDTQAHGRRPVVVDPRFDAAEREQFERLCPGVGIEPAVPADAELVSKTWGPVLEVWEGHATDPELRFKGQQRWRGQRAGRLRTRQRPLRRGCPGPRPSGRAVAQRDGHQPRRRRRCCRAASRYAPASPCDALGAVEHAAAPHVFIGKPCDVAAAKALAAERPALAAALPLTISIFCAGTPSLAGTQALARDLGAPSAESVLDVRYRGHGWPGDMQVSWRDATDGMRRSATTSYADGWGRILTHHKQWRCQLCADHLGEHADLSIGDPWYKPVAADALGESLVVVRTERGREAVRAALAAGAVALERRSLDTLVASQPNLEATRGAVFGRSLVSRVLGVAAPRYGAAGLGSLWLRSLGRRAKVSSFAGTARRILRQRRRQPEQFIPLVDLDAKS